VVAAHVSLGSITRIVVDDSAFSSRRFGPGFSDEGPGVSYQAPSGALSLDFNTVVVTVHRAGRGRPLVVIDPPSTHVVVDNRASPGAGILRIATREEMRKDGDHRTVVELTGKLSSARASARRRVTDPGLFTGGAFAARLAEVTETEPLPVARGVAPEDAELVARHRSETLAEIVADELAYSNNFAAEQLIRVLGHAMTGDSGDWENGLEVVRRYWDALGNDPDALLLENGSGFSDSGRVSTSALVDLIEVARDDGLLGALPVAGEAGTLRGRLRHSGKRVRAKTGTLAGVSGLSGVITDEAGTAQVAFSILINADPGSGLMAAGRREIEDAVVTTVLEHLDAWEARKISEELEPS
jgi:D-alanyl-D-alanine carboxypeptidase/D-alanyl-D-alanine-endopeptidase (penicillin-binding protein 4)